MKDNLFQNYAAFGELLKKIRQDSKNTLADVSAAIEIPRDELAKVEKGNLRPSQDLVLLLIHFFELSQETANNLMKLAGYRGLVKKSKSDSNPNAKPDFQNKHSNLEIVFGADPKQVWVGVNDSRIMYTDSAHISSNESDIVINFLQSLGNHDQPVSIARIGMNINYAALLVQRLQEQVDRAQGRSGNSDNPEVNPS